MIATFDLKREVLKNRLTSYSERQQGLDLNNRLGLRYTLSPNILLPYFAMRPFLLLLALSAGLICAFPLNVHAKGKPAPALKFASAAQTLDERGFIQVWALRLDSIQAGSLPLGQGECEYGEGEDVAEQLSLLKGKKARQAYLRRVKREQAQDDKNHLICEREQARLRANYLAMRKRFNQVWLPALKQAMSKGDPVAEVILRLCETSSVLDRTGIASDCSPDAADKQIARQRLQAIGFQPALHAYLVDDGNPAMHTPCDQADAGARSLCIYRRQADDVANRIKFMRHGFLAVEKGYNVCQVDADQPDALAIIEDCQRQQNMIAALAGRARRFYTVGQLDAHVPDTLFSLSLARPILQALPGTPARTLPFDARGKVTRGDFKEFSDPQFQEKFYRELEALIEETDANITADLQREPRWAVFLIERLNRQLFDAMDVNNPKRPSDWQIADYEYHSAWQEAIRQDQQRLAYTRYSMQQLIESLHKERNHAYWYHWEDAPLNLKEIERRPTDIKAIVEAYYADHDDGVFRLNLIMILNHKPNQEMTDTERQLIEQCLVDALQDSEPFVRMEASYRSILFGKRLLDPRISDLYSRSRQELQDYMRKERERK